MRCPRPGSSAFLFVLASAAAAQTIKLSAPLPPSIVGFTRSFVLSPDGRWVVSLADLEQQFRSDLYSVPVDGRSAAQRLAVAPDDFLVTPHSDRVLFRSRGLDNLRHIYTAAIEGGQSPLRLDGAGVDAFTPYLCSAERAVFSASGLYSAPLDASGPQVQLSATSGARALALTPDGSTAMFATSSGLFSVPIDGSGAALPLSSVTPAQFALTPDGERFVCRTDAGDLFVVWVHGLHAPQRLAPPFGPGGRVLDMLLAPDGKRVLYRALHDASAPVELFAVSITGRQPARKLYPGAVPGFGVYSVTPDARSAIVDVDGELFSVRLDVNAAPVQLSHARAAGATAGFAQVTNDSKRVVFIQQLPQPPPIYSVQDLYSVPVDGSRAPVRIHPRQGLFDGPQFVFRISPDGRSVAYPVGGVPGGYVITPIDGSAPPVQLSHNPPPSDLLFAFTPDSARLVFRDYAELASTNLATLERTLLGPPPLTGPVASDVQGLQLSPLGDSAIYLADGEQYLTRDLYLVPTDGREPARRLTNSVAERASTLFRFRYTPDATRVVFVAQQLGVANLYSVPTSGPPTGPVQLNPPLAPGHNVGGDRWNSLTPFFEISPDSRRVVYVADQDVDQQLELYSAPLDGSAPAVKISGPLVAGGDVFLSGDSDLHDFHTIRISPDGTRVVFAADAEVDEQFELYSAPIDGSAPRVKLNGGLTSGGDCFADFLISPDGTRVVYVADQQRDERFELYVVPIDGSSVPLKLNGPLIPEGDVDAQTPADLALAAQITPDSTHIVFCADAITDNVVQLFLAPLDASALPVPLTPPENSVDLGFVLSPDARRVLYFAVPRGALSPRALYSVPLDRTASPVRLSAPLPPRGGVYDGLHFGAGGRVVFVADVNASLQRSVFSAPLDGSAPALQLDAPLAVLDARQVDVSADGSSVFYVNAGGLESRLFSVPITGGAEPVLRVPQLRGDPFYQDRFAPIGGGVMYLADLDTPSVIELYATFIGRQRARR